MIFPHDFVQKSISTVTKKNENLQNQTANDPKSVLIDSTPSISGGCATSVQSDVLKIYLRNIFPTPKNVMNVNIEDHFNTYTFIYIIVDDNTCHLPFLRHKNNNGNIS